MLVTSVLSLSVGKRTEKMVFHYQVFRAEVLYRAHVVLSTTIIFVCEFVVSVARSMTGTLSKLRVCWCVRTMTIRVNRLLL